MATEARSNGTRVLLPLYGSPQGPPISLHPGLRERQRLPWQPRRLHVLPQLSKWDILRVLGREHRMTHAKGQRGASSFNA